MGTIHGLPIASGSFSTHAFQGGKALKLECPQGQGTWPSTSILFPRGPSKPTATPFPEEFKQVLDLEWKNPTSNEHFFCIVNKLYTLPEQVMSQLQVFSVDPHMAAL